MYNGRFEMKRIFSIIALVLILCLAMTSCIGGSPSEGDDETIDNDTSIYGQLTKAMSSREFETLTVTVTTTSGDGLVLTSIYVYETVDEGLKIEYLIENFGQFTNNNGIYTKPDSMIELIEGSVIVDDNCNVVSSTGDPAPFDLSSADYPKLNFKEAYFSGVAYSTTSFSANVISPKSFVGLSGICSNMKVLIDYDAEGINRIDLSYNGADGYKVETEYIYE